MKIRHKPIFDPLAAEEIYSKKDGVPVKYVCTSGNKSSIYAMDIFYRKTPHPSFGNRYFGLYNNQDARVYAIAQIMITSADWIEDLEFGMINSGGWWFYSSHRWDMVQTDIGFIDGGREYVRVGGTVIPTVETFVVRDGKFVEKHDESSA